MRASPSQKVECEKKEHIRTNERIKRNQAESNEKKKSRKSFRKVLFEHFFENYSQHPIRLGEDIIMKGQRTREGNFHCVWNCYLWPLKVAARNADQLFLFVSRKSAFRPNKHIYLLPKICICYAKRKEATMQKIHFVKSVDLIIIYTYTVCAISNGNTLLVWNPSTGLQKWQF